MPRKPADPAPAAGEPCIFAGCVSRERHFHGGFPGGYDNPDNPDGPPIEFTAEPAPGVRDYNGAILAAPLPSAAREGEAEAREQGATAERERVRAALGSLGGLEYGSADEGLRYLNADYVSRTAVLAILDAAAGEP